MWFCLHCKKGDSSVQIFYFSKKDYSVATLTANFKKSYRSNFSDKSSRVVIKELRLSWITRTTHICFYLAICLSYCTHLWTRFKSCSYILSSLSSPRFIKISTLFTTSVCTESGKQNPDFLYLFLSESLPKIRWAIISDKGFTLCQCFYSLCCKFKIWKLLILWDLTLNFLALYH